MLHVRSRIKIATMNVKYFANQKLESPSVTCSFSEQKKPNLFKSFSKGRINFQTSQNYQIPTKPNYMASRILTLDIPTPLTKG